jgi:acyl-[acyl-carrier-protein]-phospholipid O-acyltransferase/long-chain-fatty-acid--[acyl-carrier-protein] ligase
MKKTIKRIGKRILTSDLGGLIPVVLVIVLLGGGASALLLNRLDIVEPDSVAEAALALGMFCRPRRKTGGTFKWLNITQFTGALNDNAFKMLTVISLAGSLKTSLNETLAIASVLLVTPFLLFSTLAGSLADRFSKQKIVIITKWAELAILLAAIPAVASGLAWPVYVILFLRAAQSAFFGPAKRGIVPELVEAGELSRANGALTGATYIAIILGLFLPSLAATAFHAEPLHILTGCMIVSICGLIAAHRIAPTPSGESMHRPTLRVVTESFRSIKMLPNVWLRRAVYGSIAFAGLTALFQQNLVLYARDVANLSVEASGFLFLIAALGIAGGALLTGRWSKHTIEFGLIPVGVIGLTGSITLLSLVHTPSSIFIFILLAGASAGICIVPLNAYIQQDVPADRRGKIFGAAGFFSFAAMVAASGIFWLLTNTLHADARLCMLVTGLGGLIAAVWALLRLPDYMVRFLISRLTRALYRIDVQGLENLPREGGALIVSNHTAYGDATIIQSATQRPIRYLMSREVFHSWKLFNPIFRLTGAIPVHTSDGPRKLAESLGSAREALKGGALISIFPEGELSKNGNMMTFHKGFEKILKGTDVPVIPVHLDNLWGSIFSFRDGKPGFRIPRQFPRPVTVRFGKPLPTNVSAAEARRAVAELGVETAIAKSLKDGNTLSRRLVRSLRRNRRCVVVKDTSGRSLTGGKLLSASALLGHRLQPQLQEEQNVGVLLPPTVAGALANTALTLMGKTVVNLNWTVPSDALRSAVEQSDIRHIVTSRKFLEKAGLPDLPAEPVYIEEQLISLSVREQIGAWVSAHFTPIGRESKPTDTACIIFSSGSTGTPKGVMLSHANLLANIDSLQRVIAFDHRDSIAGILPLFHSFGTLGTLWWPLLNGVKTVYHPNPLQPMQVVRLVRDEQLTALLATPTLLQTYLRKAEPSDFKSLRYAITGGEKLPETLADAFEEKFGLRPLQGYGATELSPVAALSLPNQKIDRFRVTGNKPASTGHPLPNIAVRVTDPETGAVLPLGETGLLWIKGPNVMQGYLNQPNKTAEVLQDGWYNTGDIARIDEEGFIYLTDRLARFSKIGGEMVPHGAIEEILQKACGAEEPCVAVIGVPGERGEELAVCCTPQAAEPDILHAILKDSGLPNLWIPRRSNFVTVEKLPILGTGKLDLCALRELAGNQ